jgi:hypothetical protein
MFRAIFLAVVVVCGLVAPCMAETLASASSRADRQPEQKTIEPGVPDAAVIAAILALSRAAYPGICGCPNDTARDGSRCGDRSAHSKPRGRFVYCYASDVTPGMILDHRAGRLQLPLAR